MVVCWAWYVGQLVCWPVGLLVLVGALDNGWLIIKLIWVVNVPWLGDVHNLVGCL